MNHFAHHYLLEGLAANPVIMSHQVKQFPKSQWDLRPDPDRFTFREVMAHMADMEEVWLERINNILKQEGVSIPGRDPDELAAKNNYKAQDPQKCLKRFETGRGQLLGVLKDLKPEQWDRSGVHSEYGKISIRDLAQGALGHDSYHLRQISDWIVPK